MTRKKRVNRAATERLSRLIAAELSRQEITAEEAARNARLPSSAFRSVLRYGYRPTIDRAEELLRALQISMKIGAETGDAGEAGSGGKTGETDAEP